MGYDVKTMTKQALQKSTSYSNLFYRKTFEEDQSVLDGYKERYKHLISKIIIPEIALSYLDDDRAFIKNVYVKNEKDMEMKYNFKPELVVYNEMGNPDDYIFDFLYLNGIFSRMDFTFDLISKYKIFDQLTIDKLKTDRVSMVDSETKDMRSLGATANIEDNLSEEDKYYLSLDYSTSKGDDTIKISEDIYKLMCEKLPVKHREVIDRNMSNEHITKKLIDEIGNEDLIYYLSKFKLIEEKEERSLD